MLQVGVACNGIPENDWLIDEWELTLDEARNYVEEYRILLGFSPCLKAQLLFLEPDPSALFDISTYVKASRAARGDDLNKVKSNILKYIPKIDTPMLQIEDILAGQRKEQRGFEHVAAGRLLVPRCYRDEFDKNPDEWCRRYRAQQIEITAGDLPSFMYPESGFDVQNPTENLLQSTFLVAIFRVIFKGPSAGSSGMTEKKGGRPPLYIKYNMREVHPWQIAYTCVITRFTLNSQSVWQNYDGEFNVPHFFNMIIQLFDDKE
ncbi:uncharacterized protein LAESUDRAFT_754691 [Laetiporus sulphureus 93-53]|uniref:Uncharacterized protein n=1 Tax=Laetiporus sulphureus 93-53 TaxID=1314785 RepID=A0A165HUC9_9APHY|nr:uncharacterized protein LAESUDRAFT_754691 [Laetiporus sulphureus 93-53]KZT12198.1 hypothetical protein LAESUDRAFT_754691 [Laetiporus sulphureus 93-53]